MRFDKEEFIEQLNNCFNPIRIHYNIRSDFQLNLLDFTLNILFTVLKLTTFLFFLPLTLFYIVGVSVYMGDKDEWS